MTQIDLAPREKSTDKIHDILIAEYNANVCLWKHDDDLRQKRNGTFLHCNLLIFGLLAFLFNSPNNLHSGAASIALLSCFIGITLCIVWFIVLLRNAKYIVLRRTLLVHIEHKISDLHSLENIELDTFYLQCLLLGGGEPNSVQDLLIKKKELTEIHGDFSLLKKKSVKNIYQIISGDKQSTSNETEENNLSKYSSFKRLSRNIKHFTSTKAEYALPLIFGLTWIGVLVVLHANPTATTALGAHGVGTTGVGPQSTSMSALTPS